MDAERKTNNIEDRKDLDSKSENIEALNGLDNNTDKESKSEKSNH